MADGGSPLFACYFHKPFCDNRSCHGCSEKIFVLVNGTSLYARNNVFVTEFVNDVFYIQLGGAACLGALLKTVEFALLPAVYAAADYIVIIILLEPGDDSGSIKSSGICKYYFFFHY